jgi:hypothetical protein
MMPEPSAPKDLERDSPLSIDLIEIISRSRCSIGANKTLIST